MKMYTTNQACQSDMNTVGAGVEPESLLCTAGAIFICMCTDLIHSVVTNTS